MEMFSLTGLMDFIDRALIAVSEGLSFDSCVYNVGGGRGGGVFLSEASAQYHSVHHHLFSPG